MDGHNSSFKSLHLMQVFHHARRRSQECHCDTGVPAGGSGGVACLIDLVTGPTGFSYYVVNPTCRWARRCPHSLELFLTRPGEVRRALSESFRDLWVYAHAVSAPGRFPCTWAQ